MSKNDTQNELYMGDDTGPEEALDFVAERTANPVIFREGDIVVFNYHNKPLVPHALSEWAADAEPGIYMVAYQIPGVWAFMQRALPKSIRNADLLAYRTSSDRYVDYENWRRTLADPDVTFENEDRIREARKQIEIEAREVIADV